MRRSSRARASVGLEIARQAPTTRLVVVPLGGGGLASGVAIAIKSQLQGARVVGVQAEACAPYVDSLAAHRPDRRALREHDLRRHRRKAARRADPAAGRAVPRRDRHGLRRRGRPGDGAPAGALEAGGRGRRRGGGRRAPGRQGRARLRGRDLRRPVRRQRRRLAARRVHPPRRDGGWPAARGLDGSPRPARARSRRCCASSPSTAPTSSTSSTSARASSSTCARRRSSSCCRPTAPGTASSILDAIRAEGFRREAGTLTRAWHPTSRSCASGWPRSATSGGPAPCWAGTSERRCRPAGAEARAEQLATLARIRHERLISDELGRLIERRPRARPRASLRLRRREPREGRAPRMGEGAAGARRAARRDHPRRVARRARLGRGARRLRLRGLPPAPGANVELRRRYADCFEGFDDFVHALRPAARRLRARDDDARR